MYFVGNVVGWKWGKWGNAIYVTATDAVHAWQLVEDKLAEWGASEATITSVEPIKTYPVPFFCGDGSDEVMLDVTYIAEFPRGYDNTCAFCHGDPCAEHSDEGTKIGAYYERAREDGWGGETCPCCNGRPT